MSDQPRSELFNLVAEIAKPQIYYDALGRPLPPVQTYAAGDLSQDIAMGMLRKPLTLEEQFFIAFGTAPRKESKP